MKRAPRSRQRHDLYAKYHDYDSEISDLLGECGIKKKASLQAGAVIVGPITIGEGAIVGANSVVLNDVDDGLVVVGAPARPIVRR